MFALLLWLEFHWLGVAAWLMGRDAIVFDQQPDWIRALQKVAAAVPWVVGGALLMFALMRRRWVPVIAFAGAYLLGGLVLVGVVFSSPVARDYASRTAFDSAAWKAGN